MYIPKAKGWDIGQVLNTHTQTSCTQHKTVHQNNKNVTWYIQRKSSGGRTMLHICYLYHRKYISTYTDMIKLILKPYII